MKLNLNKNNFVNNILHPVSKLADNLLLDFVPLAGSGDSYQAKTIVSSVDNSVILMGRMQCTATDPFRCVIPDCKTFLRLFSGIEQPDVVLDINSNSINYKQSSFSFKYHLLDESYVVNKKALNEDKLGALEFDTSFLVSKQKFSEIIKFNSIVPDAEKLYFVSEDSKIFAKLGDEQKSNTNEIVTEISSRFQGEPLTEKFPINITNILLFSFGSDEIKISINHRLKIFKFSTDCLSYIVSGLVK
jgi:hypothetical protein